MDFGFWITEEKGYHHFSLNTKTSTLLSGYMSILAAWESTNGDWWSLIHSGTNYPSMATGDAQILCRKSYPNIVCGFSTLDWRFSKVELASTRLPWPSHDPPRCVSYAQPFGRQGGPNGPNGSQEPTELGHFGPPVVAHPRPPWWLPGRCGERSPPHPAILRGPVRLRELPEWFGGFVKELCIQHLQNEEGPPKTEVNLERGAVLRFFWIFCWHYSQLLYYTYSYI